jgi:deazaflavin-dependent oxidoreductase (nitroreductase family)
MATAPGSLQDRMQRRARVMKLVNRPVRWVLGLPVPTPLGRRLMVVTHVGRRTGRRYHQPVSYLRDGATLLTPGGGRWTRNLRPDQPVELRVAGRRITARPELVADPGEVERLLATMSRANRRLASFVPFVGRDGTIERDGLARAVELGFRIVRWHPTGSPA